MFRFVTALLVTISLCIGPSNVVPADASQDSSSTDGGVNCAEVYNNKPATCEHVPCDQPYRSFLGTWSGHFWSYVRERSTTTKSVYRPYENTISYSESDCLGDLETGETFIIGHQIDRYPAFGSLPAKVTRGLLITGKRKDGSPFLRTAGEQGTNDFSLLYRNNAAQLAVWQLHIPSSGGTPEMTYTTIDGQDFSVPGNRARDVTITLTVGPPGTPYWEGVIAYGTHTRT